MRMHSIKGMRDILPPEVCLWQCAEEKAREVFERYGYREIRTPILEETSLFHRAIGEGTDIVNKEMYTFTDRGGRSLTLRPEGTAPIVRAYIENNLGADDLLKLYYLGPMFRSERPQKGRSRQFHQIGIEAIGSADPSVDAGAVVMMADFFDEIGLDKFAVKICSLGCPADKEKLAKGLRAYLAPEENRLCDDCKLRLKKNVLRTLDCKVESCKSVLRASPKAKDFLCGPCGEHYAAVKKYLKEEKVSFTEDDAMVRGLDYYSRTVFEVTHPALGAQDAIAAGGRYDNLIADFGGKETGAFGFAIGVERMLMALSEDTRKGLIEKRTKKLDLYIAMTNRDFYAMARSIFNPLRKKGYYCEINFRERSLKSQLRLANKKNARVVIILGDEEAKRGEAVWRDMATSQQRTVKLNDIAREIEKNLRVHVKKNA